MMASSTRTGKWRITVNGTARILAILLVAVLEDPGCRSDRSPPPPVLNPASLEPEPSSDAPTFSLSPPEPPSSIGDYDLSANPSFAGPREMLSGGELSLVPMGANYQPTWLQEEQEAGSERENELGRVPLAASYPFWQDAATEWTASGGIRDGPFAEVARLTGKPADWVEDSWNLQLAAGYRHWLDNGWIDGARLRVESAGARPFDRLNELTAEASVFLQVPQERNGSWVFRLNYSTANDRPWPLPRVERIWQPSEGVRARLGLAFPLYRPAGDLSLDLLLLRPRLD